MWNPFRTTEEPCPPPPPALLELIAQGHWPANEQQERLQNHNNEYISREQVRAIAPDERELCLHAPPFMTLAQRLNRGEEFWSWPIARADQLDLNKAIQLGDFELGSDSGVILDCRSEPPCVRRLKYGAYGTGKGENNQWELIANSIEEFAEKLNLKAVRF